MNALLEKFTKVTVKVSTLLPSEDKVALDTLHRQYEEAMEQLDEWRLFFEQEMERNPLPGFILRRSDYGNKELSVDKPHNFKSDDPFVFNRFFVGYPLRDIEKKLTECRTAYISKAYDHFSKKYALTINVVKDNFAGVKKLTYMDVVDDIRKQFNGLNFNAIAKEQIINKFRSRIFRRDRVILNNKNIELKEYYHRAEFEWYRDDAILPLENAIMFFERNEPAPGRMFNDTHWGKYVDYTQDYTFINCEKLEGMRFFKNNKVILKFKTAAIAKAFYEFFDFSSLPEKW
jgi:hypothetical protein